MILQFFKKGPWGPFEASEAFDYEIKIYSALKVVRLGEVQYPGVNTPCRGKDAILFTK